MSYSTLDIDLIKAIDFIEDAFLPDELAYQLITSKSELLLRDRIAFYLYRLYKKNKLDRTVAREWKRYDLGILDGQTPVGLVEAKLFYYFDLLETKGLDYVQSAINKDTHKLALAKNKYSTGAYNLLFCNKLMGVPSKEHMEAIKYFSHLKRFSKQTFDFEVSKSKIKHLFPKHALIYSKEIICGTAFNMSANLEIFLLKM